MIAKPDESLGRKATEPLKWQPFLRCYFIDVTIIIL